MVSLKYDSVSRSLLSLLIDGRSHLIDGRSLLIDGRSLLFLLIDGRSLFSFNTDAYIASIRYAVLVGLF